MELKQKYLNKVNEEHYMAELKSIVNSVFNLDITCRVRLKSHVQARMVFSKILRERGFAMTSIAKFFNMDSHTSIINYMRKFDHDMNNNELFRNRYTTCREIFFDRYPSNEVYNEIKVDYVPKSVQLLISEVEARLEKKYAMNVPEKFKRFRTIIDMLDERIPHGKETMVEQKVLRMLNGL